ncbi:lipoprotein [Klebsiella pneumoniae]|uniref:Lipoprotein n=1 Tax=Klebsiella pneumoniae TaxID=573 RepID=A0A378C5C8_KLEPN|nr:lipoprotein [Klebsiella pneumoniae]
MESSVLAAGISASEPAVVATEIQATASPTLYNERQQPVTVHYRFFWYDARGLEMHPLDAPRHHRGTGPLLGHVIWQRQYPGGA